MTAAVRLAKPVDAAAVEQVRFAAWQAAYGRLVPPEYFEQFDHAAAVTRWRDSIANGTRHAHVAELDGEIVGFCSYGPCRDDDLPAAGEIYAIYVRPEHWSTGIGRALLPAAIDALQRKPIVLWVLRENSRARGFYELFGLLPDGASRDTTLLGDAPLPEVRYRLLH